MRQIIILIILLTIFTFLARADELQIGYSCYPKELQQVFANHGYKLDLSGNDRDELSWGFIENKGSRFSIFTYRQLSVETLTEVRDIITEALGG